LNNNIIKGSRKIVDILKEVNLEKIIYRSQDQEVEIIEKIEKEKVHTHLM